MAASRPKRWIVPFNLGMLSGAVLGVGLFVWLGMGEGLWGKKPPSVAEADIRKLLDDQAAARNRGDLDGFMAGYWESDELRFASGDTVTTGFGPTKDRYFKRYKADGKEMGKLTFSDITVEVVTSDYAVVRGRWALKFDKSSDEPKGLYTLTLRRFDGKWKVTTDHTSAAERVAEKPGKK